MRNREIAYLSENGEVITADSTPDLDTWGWDSFWGCDQWVLWHRLNKKKYGSVEANKKFTYYWNEQGFGAHALGCRTVDSDFRNYVRAEGMWDMVWQSAEGLKLILQPAGSILETGGTVGAGIGQGLEATSQVLKWLLPIAATGLAGAAGFYLYRKVTGKKL